MEEPGQIFVIVLFDLCFKPFQLHEGLGKLLRQTIVFPQFSCGIEQKHRDKKSRYPRFHAHPPDFDFHSQHHYTGNF